MAAFLSQHSSNPLEVSSSDVPNKAYKCEYTDAKGIIHTNHISSDDPHNKKNAVEMAQYHHHISNYCFTISMKAKAKHELPPPPKRRENRYARELIDLHEDEDMDSDNELGGVHAALIPICAARSALMIKRNIVKPTLALL